MSQSKNLECMETPDSSTGDCTVSFGAWSPLPASVMPEVKLSPDTLAREEREAQRTVELEVPEGVPLIEDLFLNHFESHRNGGGTVDDVRIEEEERVVHVVFEDPEVAQRVTARSHRIAEQTILVQMMSVSDLIEERREAQRTVEVRVEGEIPLSQDLFLNHFESTRNGGGMVEDVQIAEEEKVVHVVFQDPDVVQRVIKRDHKIAGKPVTVRKMTFCRKAAEEKKKAKRTVEVTVGEEVPLTEDLFINHFENARNGGGSVESVQIHKEERTVYVIFQDPEVARSAAKHSHKIAGQPVEVKMRVLRQGQTAKGRQTKERTTKEPHKDKCSARLIAEPENPPANASKEEGEAQRAVEVRVGEDIPLTKDLFLNHFENPRNGGDTVEDVQIDEEKRVVYVIFRHPEVAAEVAKRQHKILEKLVSVKTTKSMPTYPDKLLFKNVPDNVDRFYLSLFVERVTGHRDLEILYGERPNTVLVKVDGDVDFKTANSRCQEQDLNGSAVQVSKVPVSSCLMVTNVDPKITEPLIKLYFESAVSLGGPVASVERRGENGKCFVQFQDCKDAERVLQRTHFLEDKKLELKLYLPCLGEDGGSHDPNTFVMPEDLVVSGIEEHKLSYLNQTLGQWEEFCKQLAPLYAKPSLEGGVLTVKCSLTAEVPKARVLSKTWHRDAQKIVDEYLGLLDVRKQKVIREIWKDADAAVREANIVNTKEAIVLTDPQELAYIVVGTKKAAADLFKKVQHTIKALEDEVERKKQEITEKKKLKPGQLQFLLAIGFPSQAKEKSPYLLVETGQNEIIFHGNLSDVREAKLLMFDRLETFTTKSQTIGSELRLLQLRQSQVQQYISEKLKVQSPTIVWEVNDRKGVNVHGLEKDDLENALAYIDSAVRECEIQLPPESLDLPATQGWTEMVSKLTADKPGLLSICSRAEGKVVIIGIENVFEKARDEVNDFLNLHTVYTEIVFFSPSVQKFINNFMLHRLQETERILWSQKVQINLEANEKIKVSGRKQGLAQAKSKLQDLEKDIVCCKESVTDSAKIAFLETPKCQRELEGVAMTDRCVFALAEEMKGMQVESSSDEVPVKILVNQTRRGVQTASTVLYQGVAFSVLEGDITQMPVDVIVNAANNRMEHSGGLAKDVVRKGGQDIQVECKTLLKKRGSLKDGDVLISGPGRLPCKAIIHAVGPVYTNGTSGEKESLQLTISNCLEYAVTRGFDSIALPAISSGIFCYPPAEATQVIVGAVRKFVGANKTCGLKEVFFCALDETMRLHFQAAFSKCFGQSTRHALSLAKSSYTAGVFKKPDHHFRVQSQEKTSKPAAIKIVEGKIAQQVADVIVNSTSVELNLKNGAVSKSLHTAAPQMQEECKQKYPKGIAEGEIAVTKGYDLSCKEVFHLALPQWNNADSKVTLHNYVVGCLELASSKGYTSVAFPVLGTGNCGFPLDVVAQTMLRAMEEFQKTRPHFSVKEIKVVVFPTDTQILQAFREEQERGTGSSQAAMNLAWANTRFSRRRGLTSSKTDGATASLQAKVTRVSKHKLSVVKTGLLAEQKVDAIVNSASSDLDLTKGSVAASILKGAGQEIQDECKAKCPQGIKAGEVVTTKGYKLPCKEVLHTNLNAWRAVGDEKTLRKTVISCLDLATKHGHTTVAFPAMGTGNLNYPHDVVAKTMLDAVDEFQQTRATTSLREVRIVVFDGDKQSVQAFKAATQMPKVHTVPLQGAFAAPLNSSGKGSFAINKLQVTIKNGDITNEDATAIVNSSNETLDLTRGAVANELAKKCGAKLIKECKEKEADMKKNGFAWTEAYNLKSHQILHINAEKFAQNGYASVIEQCLTEANNMGVACIAMPAFGTGIGLPVEVLAKDLFEAAKAFRSTKKRSLKEIRMVIFEDKMTEAMFREMKALAETVNTKKGGGTLGFGWFGGSSSSKKIQVMEQPSATTDWDTRVPFWTPKEPKTLFIYAENQRHIDNFKQHFEQLVDEKITKKTMSFETHSEDHNAQVLTIQSIGQQHNVQTDVRPDKGCIVLYGFKSEVLEAYAAISDFLKYNLVASMVQWCFLEVKDLGHEQIEYEPKLNAAIEASYKKQEKKYEFTDVDSEVYVIDFGEMVEYKKSDPQSHVAVQRRMKMKESGTDLPPHWAPQEDDLDLVRLNPKDAEYKKVEANFLSTAGNRKVTVTEIQRVQSRTLYSQYQSKKTQLETQNPKIQNEKTLWHGTASDATDNINRYGFNRSYCGKNNTCYGEGVYFAVNSSYSIQGTYSPQDASGNCRIYQCKVLVGYTVVGQRGMRILPQRTDSNLFYDSATNAEKDPVMYVIFNDTQAYPEYLITFKFQ